MEWYRRAAEQGYAVAQHQLGLIYFSGEGVPADGGEAAKWFRQAAEQGHVSAQYHLGLVYFFGMEVPADHVQAHFWFDVVATASGNVEARKNRNLVAKEMTPEQIAEAQWLAREWWERHQE